MTNSAEKAGQLSINYGSKSQRPDPELKILTNFDRKIDLWYSQRLHSPQPNHCHMARKNVYYALFERMGYKMTNHQGWIKKILDKHEIDIINKYGLQIPERLK